MTEENQGKKNNKTKTTKTTKTNPPQTPEEKHANMLAEAHTLIKTLVNTKVTKINKAKLKVLTSQLVKKIVEATHKGPQDNPKIEDRSDEDIVDYDEIEKSTYKFQKVFSLLKNKDRHNDPSLMAKRYLNVRAADKVDDLNSDLKWRTIFIDLVALLLTFFVMLMASSKVDMNKWSEVSSSLNGLIQTELVGAKYDSPSQFTLVSKDLPKRLDDSYFRTIFESKIEGTPLFEDIEVQADGGFIKLLIPTDKLFEGAKFRFAPKGEIVLEELAEIFHNLEVDIKIQTWTSYDNDVRNQDPIMGLNAKREVSMWRSQLVRTFLINKGYTGNIDIIGSATKTAQINNEKVAIFVAER